MVYAPIGMFKELQFEVLGEIYCQVELRAAQEDF